MQRGLKVNQQELNKLKEGISISQMNPKQMSSSVDHPKNDNPLSSPIKPVEQKEDNFFGGFLESLSN